MPITSGRHNNDTKGRALLAVLWLSVALSVIALTVAGTVRGEVDRAATAADDTRAYFLAQSAIQRAILYIEWGRAYGPPQLLSARHAAAPVPFPARRCLGRYHAGKLQAQHQRLPAC